mmetsp:Transcript_17901/g.23700  ORF Transcript_17901/g.23700 Transcript_17901/m.23700 type:complete len:248 (-) Transcript_17901:35-778(-)
MRCHCDMDSIWLFYLYNSNLSINLERSSEGIKLGNRRGSGSGAGLLLPESGSSVGCLDSLEEFLCLLLLLNSLGKTTDGSSGLVHVTGQLILDVEPFLPGDVCLELGKTDLGLTKDGLLARSVIGVVRIVESLLLVITVNGVRRVNLGALVRSVSSTLRVRGSVTDDSENRETRRLSSGGVGGNWEEHGGSSTELGHGLTAGVLSLHGNRGAATVGGHRGEGRSRGDKGGEDSKLHFSLFSFFLFRL